MDPQWNDLMLYPRARNDCKDSVSLRLQASTVLGALGDAEVRSPGSQACCVATKDFTKLQSLSAQETKPTEGRIRLRPVERAGLRPAGLRALSICQNES